MALVALSDEISRHIEAVIVLSKRDVLLKILEEAELCLQSEQLTAATVLAEIVLKEASFLLASDTLELQEGRTEGWLDIRNRAAHSASSQTTVTTEERKAMLTGIRQLLEQIDRPQGRPTSPQPGEDKLTKTRGKYAFVQTSVEEFLKRKHDDLEREAW